MKTKKAIEVTQHEILEESLSDIIADMGRQAAAYTAVANYFTREGEVSVGKKVLSVAKSMSSVQESFLETWQSVSRSGKSLSGFHKLLSSPRHKCNTFVSKFTLLSETFSSTAIAYREAGEVKMARRIKTVAHRLRSAADAIREMQKQDKSELAVFKGARPHFSAHVHSGTKRIVEPVGDDETSEPSGKCLGHWSNEKRLDDARFVQRVRQVRHNETQQMLVTA